LQTPKNKNQIQNKNLFNHLKQITELPYDKNYFSNLSEGDIKTFDIYMINKYLSMNQEWIFIVNYLQKYTLSMPKEIVYKLYSSILPKSKIFLKYVKASDNHSFNNELINVFCIHFECSKKEAKEYIELLISTKQTNMIAEICQLYGKTDEEVKKIMKWE